MEWCENIRKSSIFCIMRIGSKRTRQSQEIVSRTIIPMDRQNLVVTCRNGHEDNPELKNQGGMFFTKQENHTVSQLIKMTSDWCKMRRIMALVILFIKKTQKRCHNKPDGNLCSLVDVKLLEAQSYIIKMVQHQSIHFETDALRATKDINLPISSSLPTSMNGSSCINLIHS